MKQFFIKAGLFSFVCFAPIMGYNLWFDKYAIFWKDAAGIKISPNERYVKTRHVISHPDKYDSFLFGTSRTDYIPVDGLPSGSWYNFSYPRGVPDEYLSNIKLMLKKGVRIRTLAVSLDILTYKIDPKDHLTQALWKPYPICLYDKIDFYVSYLILQPKKLFEPVAQKTKTQTYDYYNTGTFFTTQDIAIEKNMKIHMTADYFKIAFHVDAHREKETLAALKSIVKICRDNNIKLILFMNPEHPVSYFSNGVEQYNAFKKQVAEFSDFWDFSGLNSVTLNNYYFYEAIHFRGMTGKLMLARMFGISNIAVPSDFGVYVSKNTIDRHVALLRSQAAEYQKSRNLK